jgi:hypothetical protein
MSGQLGRQLAAEKERADYAWKNTRTIEAARQEEMRKRDAAESEVAKLRGFLEKGMRQEKLDPVVSGALYDFVGWLATRSERFTLSSVDDAAPAAEAVKDFLALRGVDMDCKPMIHDWPARCSMVTAGLASGSRIA